MISISISGKIFFLILKKNNFVFWKQIFSNSGKNIISFSGKNNFEFGKKIISFSGKIEC